MSTKISWFCTNMDLLILHGTVTLGDSIHLPRPNTSNIVMNAMTKILEFMYSGSDLNHHQN